MISRRRLLGYVAAVPVLGATMRPTFAAASPEVFTRHTLAINGYDPVAYFTQSAPVEGTAQHRLMWRGTTWQFASADNRKAFEADPTAYAPRYGGYCAYAVAHGALATTVPEAWTVHDGRLYLNFSLAVRDQWRQDIPGYIRRANANWPKVLG